MAPGALLSWASVSPSFWVGSVCHAGLQAGPPVCPWDVRAFVRLPQGLCGPKLAPPPPASYPPRDSSSSSLRCVVSRREWMGSACPGVECLQQNCVLEKCALMMTRLPSPLLRLLLAPAQSPPGRVERPPGPLCLWPTCLALGLGWDVCPPPLLPGAPGSLLLELGAPRLCGGRRGPGAAQAGPRRASAGRATHPGHGVQGLFSQDRAEDHRDPIRGGKTGGVDFQEPMGLGWAEVYIRLVGSWQLYSGIIGSWSSTPTHLYGCGCTEPRFPHGGSLSRCRGCGSSAGGMFGAPGAMCPAARQGRTAEKREHPPPAPGLAGRHPEPAWPCGPPSDPLDQSPGCRVTGRVTREQDWWPPAAPQGLALCPHLTA